MYRKDAAPKISSTSLDYFSSSERLGLTETTDGGTTWRLAASGGDGTGVFYSLYGAGGGYALVDGVAWHTDDRTRWTLVK